MVSTDAMLLLTNAFDSWVGYHVATEQLFTRWSNDRKRAPRSSSMIVSQHDETTRLLETARLAAQSVVAPISTQASAGAQIRLRRARSTAVEKLLQTHLRLGDVLKDLNQRLTVCLSQQYSVTERAAFTMSCGDATKSWDAVLNAVLTGSWPLVRNTVPPLTRSMTHLAGKYLREVIITLR